MSKEFIPFAQERVMSKWENVVDYNLGDSGVHPMTTEELVGDPKVIEEMLSTGLYHPQANGILELREHIAESIPGGHAGQRACHEWCRPGQLHCALDAAETGRRDCRPATQLHADLGYCTQLRPGCSRNFNLREELNWAVDLDDLNSTVTNRTKLIAVCNPNNPSGHIMTPEEMDAVVTAADRVGAWLLATRSMPGLSVPTIEVTSSFWGRYDRVLAMGSMSKAYGMPGLRIGWIVTTADLAEEIWARQEYVTIGSAMLDNKLAAYALSP